MVQEYLETFLAQVEAEIGASLPEFVKDEFDAFLECGTDSTRFSAGAHELGMLDSNGYSISILNSAQLWRPPEGHRRDRRSRGDCRDPHPPALTRPRTAQITGAAS